MGYLPEFACGFAATLAIVATVAFAPPPAARAAVASSATCAGAAGNKSVRGLPTRAGVLRVHDTTAIADGSCRWRDCADGVLSCEVGDACRVRGRLLVRALDTELVDVGPAWRDVSTASERRLVLDFGRGTALPAGRGRAFTFDYFDVDATGHRSRRTFELSFDCGACGLTTAARSQATRHGTTERQAVDTAEEQKR